MIHELLMLGPLWNLVPKDQVAKAALSVVMPALGYTIYWVGKKGVVNLKEWYKEIRAVTAKDGTIAQVKSDMTSAEERSSESIERIEQSFGLHTAKVTATLDALTKICEVTRDEVVSVRGNVASLRDEANATQQRLTQLDSRLTYQDNAVASLRTDVAVLSRKIDNGNKNGNGNGHTQ